jgi:hypothetical protein
VSNIVTVELVVDSDAANANLQKMLGEMGSNARVVAKDFDPIMASVGKLSDKLAGMVMAGGSLYMVHRMMVATADAAKRTAEALAGNTADAADVSAKRASAYAAGWHQNEGPEAMLAEQRMMDTAAKRLANRGMYLGDAYQTIENAMQSAVGMKQEEVIGEGGVADMAARLAMRQNIEPAQIPKVATAINMTLRAWNTGGRQRMTAQGAAAWLQASKLAGVVDSEEFIAKYLAPAVAQMTALSGQPEEMSELFALLSSVGADTTGATTGTSAINDFIGLITSGRGPDGRKIDLKRSDGSDTPFWDVVRQYKESSRAYVAKQGGGQQGTAALFSWLNAKFQGKSKSIGALTAWLGTEQWDQTEADTRRLIQVDPEGNVISQMVATSRAGEFGDFGEFKQRAAATENAVRNQRAEWAASPEGQAANVLQKMLEGMPGATQKEREWVKAAFFKRVKAGENPYAASAQILSNVSARLLGLTGFDIGTDILQGNAGAFAIMTDAQRSDSAKVLMGEAQRQAEYARTGGKPLSAEDMMQIGALARQAELGQVYHSKGRKLSGSEKAGMVGAAGAMAGYGGVATMAELAAIESAAPAVAVLSGTTAATIAVGAAGAAASGVAAAGGAAGYFGAKGQLAAADAIGERLGLQYRTGPPSQEELDAARELQRAARELKRSADALREGNTAGSASRSMTH